MVYEFRSLNHPTFFTLFLFFNLEEPFCLYFFRPSCVFLPCLTVASFQICVIHVRATCPLPPLMSPLSAGASGPLHPFPVQCQGFQGSGRKLISPGEVSVARCCRAVVGVGGCSGLCVWAVVDRNDGGCTAHLWGNWAVAED